MVVVFSVILVTLCGVVGVQVNNTLKAKVLFYEDCTHFLKGLEINISFLQEDFYCYIKNFQSKSKDFSEVLLSFLKERSGEVLEKAKSHFVKDEDKKFVESILNAIGKTDSEGELSKLEFYNLKCEEKLVDAKSVHKKYSTITIKLSILFGLLVVLVLI